MTHVYDATCCCQVTVHQLELVGDVADRPAVIYCDFLIHNLHLMLPLILIVLSRLDRGIQSVRLMLT